MSIVVLEQTPLAPFGASRCATSRGAAPHLGVGRPRWAAGGAGGGGERSPALTAGADALEPTSGHPGLHYGFADTLSNLFAAGGGRPACPEVYTAWY
jgi:hypothetical protein